MKKVSSLFVLLVFGFSLFSSDASAQRRKAPRKRVNNRNRVVAQPPVDTAATTNVVTSGNMSDSLSVPIPTAMPSLRSNTAARETVDTFNGRARKLEKMTLAYENLRKDDELYEQMLWRNINIKEKMNLPFGYEAEEDNGSQQFIHIMLKAMKEGINDSTPLVAFKDDRFTQPMKLGEISSLLVGTPFMQSVPDWEKDPDGSKGIFKDSLISEEFNPKLVETFQVKQEVIFDRKTSRLHWRILGIAPLKKSVDAEGNTRGEFPLFWIYYPDFRPVLANYEAYNPRNGANRLSWEEVFESGYFSSYIVKTNINNNRNQPIASVVKDPILRLVEGDKVKEEIFNYEQNQWSY